MPGVCFDTSVLIPLVVDQLPNHSGAHERVVQERDQGSMLCCSTHALAECYAVLTALPLPRRISSEEAAHLIEANFIKNLNIVDLGVAEYRQAIQLCASANRISGQIYDALHLVAALKKECETVYTYNRGHFEPLAEGKIRIALP